MICEVEVCDGEADAPRNMCHAHYRRWRLGKPLNVKVTRKVKGGAPCTIPNCTNKVASGGLCTTHSRRKEQGKDLYAPVHAYIKTDNLEERLRHYAPAGDPDECWEWTAAVNKGYGMIAVAGSKLKGAHIVAWEIANEESVPEGLVVRHSCDNGLCTNPAHLLIGTHGDNVQDKMDRDRQLKGESVPTSILTEDEVLEICRLYDEGISQNALAEKFNTIQANISLIIRGKTWGHLTGRTAPDRPRHVKLTRESAAEIRLLYASGAWTYKGLAERFSVSEGSIANVLSGKTWA